MAPTVDELRNEIRTDVDRFERVESTAFTKESLAAIAAAVGHEVDDGRLPAKSRMRGAILRAIGEADDDTPEMVDRPLRKAELEAIAAVLSEQD